MKTVTLEVRSLKDTLQAAAETAKSGKADKSARISFASPELLWKVLTAKRWEILRALTGAGPLSIREIARRVERDLLDWQHAQRGCGECGRLGNGR